MSEHRFQETGNVKNGDALRAEDRRWFILGQACAVILADRKACGDARHGFRLAGLLSVAQLFVGQALRAIRFGFY